MLQTKENIRILHPNRNGAAEILRINEYNCTHLNEVGFYPLNEITVSSLLRFSAHVFESNSEMDGSSIILDSRTIFDRRHVHREILKSLFIPNLQSYSKRTSEEYQVGRVSIFRRNHRNSTTLALLCGRDLRSAARSTLENTFSDNSGSNEEGTLTLCDLTLHCT